MKLKCKRPACMHEWDYKGKADFYASCPKCKSSIRIRAVDDTDKNEKTE